MGATKTIPEMRDIICNEMKEIYDRSEGEDEIREVLRLEHAMELECERRETDAKIIIRGESVSQEAHLQLSSRAGHVLLPLLPVPTLYIPVPQSTPQYSYEYHIAARHPQNTGYDPVPHSAVSPENCVHPNT